MTIKPSQKGFEALFDAVPDSLFLIDPETSNILHCNRMAHRDLGYERADLLGQSVLNLAMDVTDLPHWEQIADTIRSFSPRVYVFAGRHRHRNGHEISVEMHTHTVELDGRTLFLSCVRNLTQRNQRAQELLSRQAHVLFALNDAADGLWDWQVKRNEVFLSTQLKRMLGYGPHETLPNFNSWATNVHEEDRERVFLVLNQHLQGLRERYEAQYRLRNRNGHYLWVHDRGRVCERDTTGQAARVVGMLHNITDHKSLELNLMRQAAHDSLTGLRNRRESERAMNSLLSTCQRLNVPLGVCMFDIDHFKHINDLFGHLVGDQVLIRIAQGLLGALRASDSLFRWGGEEFLLLAPGMDEVGMTHLGEKLRSAVAHMDWRDLLGTHSVTASFGIALMPVHGCRAGDLLLAADTALYQAKTAGRNRVVMAPAGRSISI